MFAPIDNNVSFPKLEEEILLFWREQKIYEKSQRQRENAESFVFFEGPPTANGMPHPGHCLTRAIKDLFPRYQTMRGKRCTRKAGWDTHGLPVEVEVCKELGIHSKEDIEAYGVEPFIQLCQRSVWRYMQEWERLTERLGFWVNLEEAYVTYHQCYIESVWWSLKNLFDRGLLYQGHKIVWWWAQGGTALSSGEVGQGYKSVADPSVFVIFPLVDQPDTSLLVWTTTPWTLPSNQFAAVNAEIEYATVFDAELGRRLILAKDLVEKIGEKVKRELKIESTCLGRDLIGKRYVPPFDYYYKTEGQKKGRLQDGGEQHLAWRITSADFVTTDSGSGAVHEAPAFGEVDFELLQTEQARFVDGEGPQLICGVAPNGKFIDLISDFAGQWVKDADKGITRRLKEEGKLYFQEQYLHEYPFCWRADNDPLIQYPRKSWFIRTTRFRDDMLDNNCKINWLPEHIRDGRFGNFLESNVDWALSRERYWGTPLPIWVCEKSGNKEAVASYDELLKKPGIAGTEVWAEAKKANPDLVEDLKIHKPYIDAVTYDSPFEKGARMRRVSEVIDCWYDSGAMPFAQWGYPHVGQDQFDSQFPADFISEALDQTRGWFYSLLAISTMLFEQKGLPRPFRNCIVLGLMLGEDGQKMSKSKRNYREPTEIFNKYGADALRWYFFAKQPPWTEIRYREQAIKDSIPEFILRTWNVFSFFVNYANSDGFDPTQELSGKLEQLSAAELRRANSCRPTNERAELDRWILSELNRLVADVTKRMDDYDSYGACQQINSFVDALSNWYVRRSRERFWSNDKRAVDKLDAYWTLYECLLTLSKVIAPFVPFIADVIWRNLTKGFDAVRESVHLTDFPVATAAEIDDALSLQMELIREIASLGRAARMDAKLKVRQPLQGVTVALNSDQHRIWLQSHDAILKDELNVKGVEYIADAASFVEYEIQPNFKKLGPKVGKLLPKLKQELAAASGADLLSQLSRQGHVILGIEGTSLSLTEEDIQVRLKPKSGWAAAQGRSCVVILSTELTTELIQEGIVRDVVRAIQDCRKQSGLDYSDRIHLKLQTKSAEVKTAVEKMAEYVRNETLALSLDWTSISESNKTTLEVGEDAIDILLTKATTTGKM
jgi:isoleucyl-tRNA synthetase